MTKKNNNPFSILTFFLIFTFIIILVNLYIIQIREKEKYSTISKNNYIRIKKVFPTRGEIFDRNFKPLAINWPVINVYIKISKIKNKQLLFDFLLKNTNLTKSNIDNLEKRFNNIYLKDYLIIHDVDYDTYITISENINYYPSLYFVYENSRKYLINSHFLGYIRNINQQEYNQKKKLGYSINDRIGKSGLEKQYETVLRGEIGFEILQKDAFGKDYGMLSGNLSKPVKDGSNIVLTIDKKFQEYIATLVNDSIFKGFIGVMDVKSGGLLSYLSIPSFNTNKMIDFLDFETWQAIRDDSSKAILNRGIMALYPPASIFKLIVGSLGINEKIVKPEDRLEYCKGYFKFGRRIFRCWKNHQESYDFYGAIKNSCDVYFYDLSLSIDLNRFKEFTKQNFLTVKTGIDIPEEKSGFFPSKAWYKDNYGKRTIVSGYKINLSIGQGEILVTPIQILSYINALARNGDWIQPYFLKTIVDDKKDFSPKTKKLPVSKELISILKESLRQVVNEKGGTGIAARSSEGVVYGKTGSAQNSQGLSHAWFSGFFTFNDIPEISFVIILENSGGGGAVAAPIAKKIVDYYMKEIYQ